MVDANRAEIFANGLQRAAEDFGDSVEIRGAGGGHRPEIQEWLNAGDGSGARSIVGNESRGGLVQVLAEAFVIGKHESFVVVQRAADGGAELVALERWSGAWIEEIGGVEGVVAEKFIRGAVPLVAAGLRDDNDLSAGVLAEFSAVGIALDAEFAHGLDAEEHAAGSARLHIVFGGAGVFHAIEQEEILLRAIAGDGEI